MYAHEVLEIWEENPKKMFESFLSERQIFLKDGNVYFEGETEPMKTYDFFKEEWHPVKEPLRGSREEIEEACSSIELKIQLRLLYQSQEWAIDFPEFLSRVVEFLTLTPDKKR